VPGPPARRAVPDVGGGGKMAGLAHGCATPFTGRTDRMPDS
jgi:hypothetical protein